MNPFSGAGNSASLLELIEERTRQAGLPYLVYRSVADGDYSFLHPLIKEKGITDVIIAGGDGTVNQVVGALHIFGLRFGIIPCGSGNGLAFSAGIPKNPRKALDIVFNGYDAATDAFHINGAFACMLCGLGFDAQVAHDFARDPKRGLTAYIRMTVKNFFSARSYPFELVVHERVIHTDAYFVSIANSNQFGNHFTIAPKASLQDGLLDIVVLAKQNRISMLMRTALQLAGYYHLQEVEVLDEKASLIYFQSEELQLYNPRVAPLHIDGDPVETSDNFRFKAIPGCFRLIQPPH